MTKANIAPVTWQQRWVGELPPSCQGSGEGRVAPNRGLRLWQHLTSLKALCFPCSTQQGVRYHINDSVFALMSQ